METLRNFVWVALAGVLASSNAMLGAPTASRGARAFLEVPFPRSVFIWWRPHTTILPPDVEAMIRNRLDTIRIDASTEDVLRDTGGTALAFPVLATDGDRGARLLHTILAAYGHGQPLDDQWLLTLFALACNDSDDAIGFLRNELERVMKLATNHDHIREADITLPVIDSIAVAEARRGTLTFSKLQSLSSKDPDRSTAIILLGLHYAKKWMSEDKLIELLRDGLKTVPAAEIRASLDLGIQTHPVLTAIRNFLISSPDTWPITPRLLRATSAASAEQNDFLLVVNLLVMTYQADASLGRYEVDQNLIERFRGVDLSKYPQAGFAAKVLETCTPSADSVTWNRYIHELASTIRAKDVEMADYLASRTKEMTDEKKALYGPQPPVAPGRPGVYLYGMTRAGGTIHRPHGE